MAGTALGDAGLSVVTTGRTTGYRPAMPLHPDPPYRPPSGHEPGCDAIPERPAESSNPPVGRAERLAFGLGDTASNLYWKTFEFFLLYFYTDVFGLPPSICATLFLVTRLTDAISDPVIGLVADRTRTRWGRYRPYLVWIPVPLGVAAVAMFTTPPWGVTTKTAYAYVTYATVMILYTAVNTPYGAMVGVMTDRDDDRLRLTTARFILAFAGAITVQYATLGLVQRFGGGDDRVGFQRTMGLFAVFATILFGVCFAGTRERSAPPRSRTAIGSDIRALLRNRPWIVLCGFGLVTTIGALIRNTALVIYVIYVLNRPAWVPVFLVGGSIASILGMTLTRRLAGGFGKRRLLIAVNLAMAAAAGSMTVLPPSWIVPVLTAHFAAAIATGPKAVLLWTMYAEAADWGRRHYDSSATALVFSSATFFLKVGGSLGAAAAAAILAWADYQPPVDGVAQVQSEVTTSALRWIIGGVPAAFFLAAAAILSAYPKDLDSDGGE